MKNNCNTSTGEFWPDCDGYSDCLFNPDVMDCKDVDGTCMYLSDDGKDKCLSPVARMDSLMKTKTKSKWEGVLPDACGRHGCEYVSLKLKFDDQEAYHVYCPECMKEKAAQCGWGEIHMEFFKSMFGVVK